MIASLLPSPHSTNGDALNLDVSSLLPIFPYGNRKIILIISPPIQRFFKLVFRPRKDATRSKPSFPNPVRYNLRSNKFDSNSAGNIMSNTDHTGKHTLKISIFFITEAPHVMLWQTSSSEGASYRGAEDWHQDYFLKVLY